MEKNFNLPLLQQLLIERTQLLNKLNLAAQHKLTLIVAPPGYGKTTLAAQFAHKVNLEVIWHSIEENEQDVPNLFKHCLSALSGISPELAAFNFAPNASDSELATQLADYLRNAVNTDFIYILDDVHYLIDSPGARAWLRAFITRIPPICHLVLIGRALPPIPVNEMIARREVLAIGQEELSFQFQEVNALAEKVGSALPDLHVEKIFSRMMGWPAGTLLALQPLPSQIATMLFDGKESAEGLFDTLAEALIKAQPPALQSFLFSSATLSRMTPSLCQSALHLTDSLEHLNEALHRNLFITQIPGGMEYHSLFRDFLQRHLRLKNWVEFSQHHINAGKWFEAENRLEEAFEHFVAAECWEQAANIAERSAHIFVSQGKVETLLHWRTQLIGTNVEFPRLHHMCAMIHSNRYEYDLADLDLTQGAEEYRSQDNETGLIQITLLKATVDNQRGNFQQAIDQAEPLSHNLSLPPNLRGYALAIVGTAELYLRHLDTALELLETALPLWRDTRDLFAIGQLLMTLEVAYLRLGRFPDAAKCVQEVMAIRRDFGEMTGIAMALNNLGYHQHLLGEYRQALETLQEGLQIAATGSKNRTESHILWTLGDLQRDRGAFREATTLYQKSLHLMSDHEPFLQASVLISLATLKRWEGKLDDAYDLAVEAKSIAEKHNLNWEHMLATVAIYAVGIERGEIEAVRQALPPIIDGWKEHPAPQLAPAVGLGAYAALMTSDKASAHQYLKLAITYSKYPANIQPVIAELVHIPLLKAFVEHYGSRYEILIRGMEALEALQVGPPESHSSVESSHDLSTYSLRVWVLGQETIERDGKIVPSSDWEAASARELFFYLLFVRASSREQLGLALWPDSSTPQIRGKFHSTLHRVRDAVGTNAIIFENDRYSINPNIDLWCDVNEFKKVIKQAQLSSPLLPHSEILWRRAVELFHGDFLSAFDADWVTDYREFLAQMYLDALLALANCVQVRGDVQEAVRLLKRALKIDPYREDIHRLLLNSYKVLGDRSIIVRHMHDLTQLFWNELGMPPSPETLTLSRTLLS